MESINFSILIIAVVLMRTALSCYCPEEHKDRLHVLWESYNDENVHDVYSGKVLEASCKCLASSGNFQCVQLGSSIQNDNVDGSATNGTSIVEKKKYTCTDNFRTGYYLSINLNKYTCDSVYQMAFGDQSYTTDSSNVEIDSRCNFRRGSAVPSSTEDCIKSFEPCSYKILVQEVYKGNYMPGDVIYSNGPKYIPRCGNPRVLEIGQTYMAGVGTRCSSSLTEWSEESSFELDELALLGLLKRLKKTL